MGEKPRARGINGRRAESGYKLVVRNRIGLARASLHRHTPDARLPYSSITRGESRIVAALVAVPYYSATSCSPQQ